MNGSFWRDRKRSILFVHRRTVEGKSTGAPIKGLMSQN